MPLIQKAEAVEPITFISLSPEPNDVVRKAMPEFSPSAGTYRSLEKDYATIGMYDFTVGRADLPDDLVYQLVEAVFKNQLRLVKASALSSAREIAPPPRLCASGPLPRARGRDQQRL